MHKNTSSNVHIHKRALEYGDDDDNDNANHHSNK